LKTLALDPGESFGWALSHTSIPESSMGLAAHWLPNYPARVNNTQCVCGAWKLGPYKDPGERFALVEQLISVQAVPMLSVQKGSAPVPMPQRREPALAAIVYEVAPGLRGRAAVWHMGYLATVQRVAHRYAIPFYPVNPSSWKSSVLGSARADKLAIRAHAEKYCGLQKKTPPQDAADALLILGWGLGRG